MPVVTLRRTNGHYREVPESETLLVGGLALSASGSASLYADAFTTAITIGGGANQTTVTIGRSGQTVRALGPLCADEGIEGPNDGTGIIIGLTPTGASTGSTFQAISLTTTERDQLVAADGMLIYNETTLTGQMVINGSWTNIGGGGGGGDVTGPGSSTDNAIMRWDGAAGTSAQNSGIIVSDLVTNNISISSPTGNLTIECGNDGTAWDLAITTGDNGAGTSGDITIDTGSATTTAGQISIGTTNAAGVTIGHDGGGSLNMRAGSGNSATLRGGAGTTTGGQAQLFGGTGGTGAGGQVWLQGGTGGSGSSTGGAILVRGGTGGNTDGAGGSVTIGGGAATGAGADGSVDIGPSDTSAVNIAAGTSTATVSIGNSAAGAVTVGTSSTLDLDAAGAVSINSSAGAINVGNDAVAQAINIGTGAAARTIGIGNDTGATELNLDAGTGGLNLSSTGTINLDTVAGGGSSVTIDANTAVSIDAATSSNLTVTGSAQNLTLAVAGGGTQQLILQSAGTNTNALRLNATAGGFDIDSVLGSSLTITANSAGNQELRIEATNAGAGNATITADCDDTFSLGSTNASVLIDANTALELNASGGPISIGNDAVAQAINIGTGAAARTITLGNTTSTTAVDINAGSGGVTIEGTSGANLVVGSTVSALRVADVTTTQRDALTQNNGLVVNNTTTAEVEARVNGSWEPVGLPESATANNTAGFSTTSTTATTVTGLTLTEGTDFDGPGNYMIRFDGSAYPQANNETMVMEIFVGGTLVTGSARTVASGNGATGGGALWRGFACTARAAVTSTQAVTARVRSGAGGNVTVNQGTLSLQRVR